ncbi:hypothetical protein BVY03_04665, partial [bacterium K02(2017)]
MKFSIETTSLLKAKADLLVIEMAQEAKGKNVYLKQLDKELDDEISTIIKAEEFKASAGSSKLIYTQGKLAVKYVLVVGLGEKSKFNLDVLRKAG